MARCRWRKFNGAVGSILVWDLWQFCDSFAGDLAYLDKSNVGGFFSEALTADVQAILADETSFVCADTAIEIISSNSSSHAVFPVPSVPLCFFQCSITMCGSQRNYLTYQARAPFP